MWAMASSIAKSILFKKEQTHGENPSHLILGGNVSTVKWSFMESKGGMCKKLPIHPTGSQIDSEVGNVSSGGGHHVLEHQTPGVEGSAGEYFYHFFFAFHFSIV